MSRLSNPILFAFSCLFFIQTAVAQLKPDDARKIAKEGYIYGYAMVENYKTMYGFCINPKSPVYSGFNKYKHNRKTFDPDFKLVVTPNNDTVYSTTFADLRAEPLVITTPPSGDRYYVIQLVDFSTDNFAYIGTRETGNQGGVYALVGPNYKGSLPAERFDRVIVAPSQFVALATRTAINGPGDIDGAIKIQDNLKLEGLSDYLGLPAPQAAPALDFPPYDPSRAEGIGFFSYLDMVMDWNTPRLDEEALLQRLAKIGVYGNGVNAFDASRLDPRIRAAMEEGIAAGHQEIVARGSELGEPINGWEYTPPMGNFGTDYLFRSAVAWKFLYTNSPQEALYPIANLDADGEPLVGSSSYQLRFENGALPPTDAFWSITMYDGTSRLLVPNDLKRYSIGDRTAGLKQDADGGLTLYLQHASPGAKRESNWLPAPEGAFYVIMRAYMPKPEMLSGSYRLPPIQQVK